MLAVIVVMVPLTVPKVLGYHIYAVLTGSMTPAYSVGSVVYIRTCEPETVEVGDVITFQMGSDTSYVMTHRVVDINYEEGTFITKGDANDVVDSEPVLFKRLIGKVVFCIPGLADVSDFVNSSTGKAVMFITFALAFMLWVIADLIAPRKEKHRERTRGIETERGDTAENPECKKKHAGRDIVRVVIRLVGIALVAGASVYLAGVFWEYRAGESEYKALEQLVFPGIEEHALKQEKREEDTVPGDAHEGEQAKPGVKDMQVMQAISALQEENEDVIGWITFDNMELSYPIMHGEDNEYYLTHTFSKERNSAGSIFMEAANHADFEDCHTIIYGHNMRNLSMFGQLKKYKTEEFYEEHQYFTIYTEKHVYRYQIFAYYDISEIGDIYTIGFEHDEVFGEFVNKMIRRSYYDADVEVTEQDKVITLSTCSSEGNRFVVNAKRIEEK